MLTCHIRNCDFKTEKFTGKIKDPLKQKQKIKIYHTIFLKFKDFIIHMMYIHSVVDKMQLRCCHPDCSASFNTKNKFFTHINSNHGIKNPNQITRFKCKIDECQLVFDAIDDFIRHYYHHLTEFQAKENQRIRSGKEGELRLECIFKDCHYMPRSRKIDGMKKLMQNHFSEKHRQRLPELFKGYLFIFN